MATRKGTPREIATQGFSSVDSLGVATQGFVEPVLGDLITGGAAGVRFIIGILTEGGVVTGGAADVLITQAYAGTGGLVIDGTAGVTVVVNPVIGGDIVTSGAAGVSRTRVYLGAGGVVVGGDATEVIVSTSFTGSGGVVIGGAADTELVSGVQEVGRGSPGYYKRRPFRLGDHTFEPATYDPDLYLTPADYWKRIEKAHERSRIKNLKLFKHTASGGLITGGRSRLSIISRDLPGSSVVIAAGKPTNNIVLEIPDLYATGATNREIAIVDDRIVLNDLLGTGSIQVKPGAKNRYITAKPSSAGGSATVSFKPASAPAVHFDRVDHQKRIEDEELMMGEFSENHRRNQEDDELELLGIFD